MPKLKWVVEIEVDSVWVADGFDPDNDQLHEMVCTHLAHASFDEIKTKILKRPADSQIAKLQGYKSTTLYRAMNWKKGKRI